MDAPAKPAPTLARRWAMSLIAALIVYGNLAVALQPPPLGFTVLPRPRWLFDMFLMTGMFNSYTTTNYDFRILGLRDQGEGSAGGDDADQDGSWIVLEVSEHFPQRLGLTFTQLYAPHHREVMGVAGQLRAWETLARKIRLRHNRLHPDRRVVRVKFGTLEWPISPGGYRAGKHTATTRYRNWFTEQGPP